MAKRNAKGFEDQRPDSEKELYNKQQDRKRKLNQSKKMLAKMREVIPEEVADIPFEGFHDMKQNDKEAYKEIYGKYLSRLHKMRKEIDG